MKPPRYDIVIAMIPHHPNNLTRVAELLGTTGKVDCFEVVPGLDGRKVFMELWNTANLAGWLPGGPYGEKG